MNKLLFFITLSFVLQGCNFKNLGKEIKTSRSTPKVKIVQKTSICLVANFSRKDNSSYLMKLQKTCGSQSLFNYLYNYFVSSDVKKISRESLGENLIVLRPAIIDKILQQQEKSPVYIRIFNNIEKNWDEDRNTYVQILLDILNWSHSIPKHKKNISESIWKKLEGSSFLVTQRSPKKFDFITRLTVFFSSVISRKPASPKFQELYEQKIITLLYKLIIQFYKVGEGSEKIAEKLTPYIKELIDNSIIEDEKIKNKFQSYLVGVMDWQRIRGILNAFFKNTKIGSYSSTLVKIENLLKIYYLKLKEPAHYDEKLIRHFDILYKYFKSKKRFRLMTNCSPKPACYPYWSFEKEFSFAIFKNLSKRRDHFRKTGLEGRELIKKAFSHFFVETLKGRRLVYKLINALNYPYLNNLSENLKSLGYTKNHNTLFNYFKKKAGEELASQSSVAFDLIGEIRYVHEKYYPKQLKADLPFLHTDEKKMNRAKEFTQEFTEFMTRYPHLNSHKKMNGVLMMTRLIHNNDVKDFRRFVVSNFPYEPDFFKENSALKRLDPEGKYSDVLRKVQFTRLSDMVAEYFETLDLSRRILEMSDPKIRNQDIGNIYWERLCSKNLFQLNNSLYSSRFGYIADLIEFNPLGDAEREFYISKCGDNIEKKDLVNYWLPIVNNQLLGLEDYIKADQMIRFFSTAKFEKTKKRLEGVINELRLLESDLKIGNMKNFKEKFRKVFHRSVKAVGEFNRETDNSMVYFNASIVSASMVKHGAINFVDVFDRTGAIATVLATAIEGIEAYNEGNSYESIAIRSAVTGVVTAVLRGKSATFKKQIRKLIIGMFVSSLSKSLIEVYEGRSKEKAAEVFLSEFSSGVISSVGSEFISKKSVEWLGNVLWDQFVADKIAMVVENTI